MQIICEFKVAGKFVKWFLEEWTYYYTREAIFIMLYVLFPVDRSDIYVAILTAKAVTEFC